MTQTANIHIQTLDTSKCRRVFREAVMTWIAGGGARGALNDLKGVFEDWRERKSVVETAVLNLAVHGVDAAGYRRREFYGREFAVGHHRRRHCSETEEAERSDLSDHGLFKPRFWYSVSLLTPHLRRSWLLGCVWNVLGLYFLFGN